MDLQTRRLWTELIVYVKTLYGHVDETSVLSKTGTDPIYQFLVSDDVYTAKSRSNLPVYEYAYSFNFSKLPTNEILSSVQCL